MPFVSRKTFKFLNISMTDILYNIYFFILCITHYPHWDLNLSEQEIKCQFQIAAIHFL